MKESSALCNLLFRSESCILKARDIFQLKANSWQTWLQSPTTFHIFCKTDSFHITLSHLFIIEWNETRWLSGTWGPVTSAQWLVNGFWSVVADDWFVCYGSDVESSLVRLFHLTTETLLIFLINSFYRIIKQTIIGQWFILVQRTNNWSFEKFCFKRFIFVS